MLLLNGTWCLADFGISRYADATTEAGETRKDYWTGAYAAPEQWTGERATSPTDIYAFGVMAYELLQGDRPFNGEWYELRNHHLHTDPPAPTVTAVLASLVQECMFKSPGSRPSAKNVLAKLQRQVDAAGDSRWGALAIANHAEVQKRAAEDAESWRAETEAQRRQRLYNDSLISWQRMSDRFKEIIDEHLPTAKVTVRHDKHWYVELGQARFGVSYPRQRWDPEGIGFDVIATSTVSVVMDNSANPNRAIAWDGRSHSLDFGDPIREGEYGWYETAFMDIGFSMRHVTRRIEPYAMDDVDSTEAAHALGNVVAPQQVAWPFTLIDTGDCDDFVQRWLEWFAAAAQLKLQRQSRMPEQDVTPNWRR